MCRLEALRKEAGADMEVAIDPEELEGLDDTAVKALYEQRLAEERARHSREVSQAPRPKGLFQRKVDDDMACCWTFCRMFMAVLQTVEGLLLCGAGLLGHGGAEGGPAEAQGGSAEGVREEQEAEGLLPLLRQHSNCVFITTLCVLLCLSEEDSYCAAGVRDKKLPRDALRAALLCASGIEIVHTGAYIPSFYELKVY